MGLQVFVSQHCESCSRSVDIAEAVAARYPGLSVEVVDLDKPLSDRPQQVFAVPTFILDGQLLCVGNQDVEWMVQRIQVLRTRADEYEAAWERRSEKGVNDEQLPPESYWHAHG